MDERKQFWIDFVEGRISVPEMVARTEERPELLDWLTGIADPKFKTHTTRKTDNNLLSDYVYVENPFDAKLQIEVYVHKGQGASCQLGRYLNIHGYFSRVLTMAFPDEGIVVDDTLDKKFNFMLDACPSYIGGHEVNHLLDALLAEIPEDLGKAKRVKLYKEKVKALFPLAGKKRPYWVQEAEWPLSPSGKPMRFVEQKKAKGKDYAMSMFTRFIFEDVDTGEVRVIEQFT